ncbi:MAG: hypothetical protein AAFT19_05640, partial [Pseudomonadota bacterium]
PDVVGPPRGSEGWLRPHFDWFCSAIERRLRGLTGPSIGFSLVLGQGEEWVWHDFLGRLER